MAAHRWPPPPSPTALPTTTTTPALCVVGREPVFNSIVLSLLQSNHVPPGSIVDAGAHKGTESCLYAMSSPSRVVHAVEPMRRNLVHIADALASQISNIRPIQAGLGFHEEIIVPSKGMRNLGQMYTPERTKRTYRLTKARRAGRDLENRSDWSNVGFHVRQLDSLFKREWGGETLGFAHFDVEGMELDVLRGSVHTLQRDLPVFTTELFVHANHTYSRELLRYTHRLGYSSFLVDEVCGERMDCRNIIHWPPSTRWRPIFGGATSLVFGAAVKKLIHINESSVLDHAFPCCAQGGACCRTRRAGGISTVTTTWNDSAPLHGAENASESVQWPRPRSSPKAALSPASPTLLLHGATACCSEHQVKRWLKWTHRSAKSGSTSAQSVTYVRDTANRFTKTGTRHGRRATRSRRQSQRG